MSVWCVSIKYAEGVSDEMSEEISNEFNMVFAKFYGMIEEVHIIKEEE